MSRWFGLLASRCSHRLIAVRRTVVAATAGAAVFGAGVQAQSECKSSEPVNGFLWGRGKDVQEIGSSWFDGKLLNHLSFGDHYSAAVCQRGIVWFWNATDSKDPQRPQIIEVKSRMKAVAVGSNKSYGLTQNGSLIAWNNSSPDKFENVHIKMLRGWLWNDKIVQICAYEDNIACVSSSGKVLAMGSGGLGQLGNGKATDTTEFEPMLLPAGEKADSVAVGKHHAAILTKSGRILMCGSDATMQLGRKDSITNWKKNDENANGLCTLTPLPIDLPPELLGKRFLKVSAGRNFTAAIALLDESRGKQVLVTFGEGLLGQLGHKNAQHGNVKVVQGLVGKKEWDESAGSVRDLSVVHVACGADHVVALLSNGATFSWGGNREMQLGNGGRAAVRTPELVMPLQRHRVVAVFAGGNASGAIVGRAGS